MLSTPYYRGVLSYPNKFTSDNLTVIVNNGTPITILMVMDGVYGTVGTPDSANPIRIIFENGVNYIDLANSMSDPMLPDVGDYNVKIQDITPSKVETTECFKKAVKSVGGNEPLAVRAITEGTTTTLDKTWQEIHDAFPNVYIVKSSSVVQLITSVEQQEEGFSVAVFDTEGIKLYKTLTASDYPVYIASSPK